jgi:hypothetical protein
VIKGAIGIARFLGHIAQLRRHLSDRPRKRRRQVTRSWTLFDNALSP